MRITNIDTLIKILVECLDGGVCLSSKVEVLSDGSIIAGNGRDKGENGAEGGSGGC